MTIDEHIEEFVGLKVFEFTEDDGLPSSAQNIAVRISVDWDAREEGVTFDALFNALLESPVCTEIEGLIIGDWGGTGEGEGSEPVIEALVSASDQFPKLRGLFLGEITMEESEISWINQSDISPLFEAFPNLEEFRVRGGTGLSLGRPKHAKLRKLVIETGGMSRTILHEVTSAELPALEHLELWLGDDGYGNDVSIEDVSRLLQEGPVDNLKYLGLKDDCCADQTAIFLAENGIPSSVEILDISMGILTDEGALALAGCCWIESIKKLDIHYHYVSNKVVERLKKLKPEVDASEQQEADKDNDGTTYRYVAVSE